MKNKSTIIINKISNGVRGVNMNKIDLVQKNNIVELVMQKCYNVDRTVLINPNLDNM